MPRGSYPRLFPEPDQTIAGIGRALREGRTSCVQILEGCLAQVDEWEPKVHAWVVLDRDRALDQARALDEELKNGNDRGPLHGIPIGIKDIIDVAGLPTACGAKRWADRTAERDASVVANLRGRGDRHGQDGHDSVCLDRSTDHAKSVEPRSHAGGLVERIRRRGRLWNVLRGDWNANGRLNHAAGVILRCGGDEAQQIDFGFERF